MPNLSTHFTLEEMIISQTAARKGIENIPTEIVIANLKMLCDGILEPLREMIGKPIRISSGYRSPALNEAIGGSATSQHCYGEAADFTVIGWGVEQTYQFIKHSGINYRQLIQEFGDPKGIVSGGWIHISISNGDGKIRENLRAAKQDGKTVYLKD